MTRLSELSFSDLSREQQEILGALPSGGRATLSGPLSVLIRLPEVCASIRDLSIRLRNESRIDDRLFEIMVLTVARSWRAQYEWVAHEPGARKAGLSENVIEAIRAGGAPPTFEHEDEGTVFALVDELQRTTRISEATYARATRLLGAESVIELVAAIGFYNLIAVVLNAFEVPLPGDQRAPFLEP